MSKWRGTVLMNTPTTNNALSAGMARLAHFEVYQLFGEFNYKIPIKLEQRITAIIAPNGSGKTICLRLINALFTRKWSFFGGVEFNSAEYHFTSGHKLIIAKLGDSGEQSAGGGLASGIELTLIASDGKMTTWKPVPDPKIKAQP